MTITVLGASGYTGRLVCQTLQRRGVDFVPAGRDAARIAAAVDGLSHALPTRIVDVTDPKALADIADASDVLISTVGPFDALGRPVLEACIANRCHYVDSGGEQGFIRWAYERHEDAVAAGVTCIPACAYDYVPGDLLAWLAADAIGDPREVHVAYGVKGLTTLLRVASKGTRTTIASILSTTGFAHVEGELREERTASERRLAWFPKPLGPTHAAGFPGGEALMVPRHHPGVETVRTYLAMPSLAAEGAQMLWSVARWGPARRVMIKMLTSGSEGPSPERRAAVRWACVAEAEGRDGRVARAWASATDVYGMSAEFLVTAAVRLADGRAEGVGVLAPSQVVAPGEWLDELADTTTLRWSVVRPSD